MRNVGEEFVLELQLLAPAHVKRGQQCLAFDGIAHGARQLLAVETAFDQIVLNALMDGVDRHILVLQSGQHDDGYAGRRFENLAIGVGAVTVGKVQIEQHHDGRLHDHRGQAGGQPGHTGDGEIRVGFHHA